MKYKKFKLNPNLKRNLETLDSELAQKLVGGINTASGVKRNNPLTLPLETGCGYFCRADCEGWCGSLSYKELED